MAQTKKNLEKFWEVTREGVKPVMYDYEDLKKSYTWIICHDYNGHIIFENYSRAMLCWYEKYEGKTNCFND